MDRCMNGDEIRLDAYAKLTLSLEVVDRRPDGYHELDALVVSVSEPHDSLVLRPADEVSITVRGPHAAEVPVDETNLAVRAAREAGASVAIELHKGIPPGAGLGGGSADAAAVLLGVDAPDPVLIAEGLGADVPFCLSGGAMRMRGIGDELEPAEVPDLWIVIATPPFGCATADVYRAYDALATRHGRAVDVGGRLRLVNDLEEAAQQVEARLVAFREAVEAAAGAPALMAGSGSSYFVACFGADAAEAARARVADAVDGQVVVGHTVEAGVRVRK
jgi:4-diphosphocytidyl-2-C-methyl-D-erythritol kinase